MINFKNTFDCAHSTISNHQNIIELSDSIRKLQYKKSSSEKIFVWSGFGTKISSELFNNSSWQKKIVGLFGNEEIWPWKFKFVFDESDRLGNQELISVLSSNPQDMIASLRIRNFDSDDPFQGSVEWFNEIVPFLNDGYTESMGLINNIIQSLVEAKEVGINLLLEKISIIINSIPNNSITLTPHLHRDGAYGHLESSIVSFYSEHITPHSSTLFFPDFDFEAASHLKPITAEIINTKFPSALAYSVTSGSLAIFSGKTASDGSKSDTRGALHMSPEGFFPTSRLVLLFRSKISY